MKPKEIVQQWVEAFNRADVEAIVSLYDENAINHQVANAPAEGKAAIKAMFEAEFAMAEMVCIPENLFEDGEWAILEWRDPLGLRGCGFFKTAQDKIVFQRGYWDKLSFLRQHNLPIEQKKERIQLRKTASAAGCFLCEIIYKNAVPFC
ncbi:nuclear transport factor 2 family protein [Christensenellaceae bacterium OttesenSCG-928-L17]|nr:nuclear transport factor 2 family protein [Christensenellaceae bacterium OttesenSCG-928-L17]